MIHLAIPCEVIGFNVERIRRVVIRLYILATQLRAKYTTITFIETSTNMGAGQVYLEKQVQYRKQMQILTS